MEKAKWIANRCIETKNFSLFVDLYRLDRVNFDPNKYFDPKDITRAFVLEKNIVPITLPDELKQFLQNWQDITGDDTATSLVLLKTMGYTRWNEIKNIVPEELATIENLGRCKYTFLKEVGAI